jgi:hypothetical protein
MMGSVRQIIHGRQFLALPYQLSAEGFRVLCTVKARLIGPLIILIRPVAMMIDCPREIIRQSFAGCPNIVIESRLDFLLKSLGRRCQPVRHFLITHGRDEERGQIAVMVAALNEICTKCVARRWTLWNTSLTIGI